MNSFQRVVIFVAMLVACASAFMTAPLSLSHSQSQVSGKGQLQMMVGNFLKK